MKNIFIPLKRCYLKSIIIFTINFLFSSTLLLAQTKVPVSGMVVAKENNDPINGVSISLQHKGISTITNADGKFIILLPSSYTRLDSLAFSCIGFRTKNISINAAIQNKDVIIQLEKLTEELKEVVIRPLTLKQLLDSVNRHNGQAFISPMKVNGYYREFVYDNAKCTEYSDALCEYYFNRNSQADGQLRINASRCIKEKKVNKDRHNVEVYFPSDINPNLAFKYAMISAMIKEYFPEKRLSYYKYTLERSVQNFDDLKVTIYPKENSGDAVYQLTLNVNNDFTLKSYHLEIPADLLSRVKEESLLGIHNKVTELNIVVNYSSLAEGIYPNYYSITTGDIYWGKMLGSTVNETELNKSEFIATDLNSSKDLMAFQRGEIFKKGNICANGVTLNDSLLTKYTIILPSSKDSIAIKSIQ